MQICAYSNNEAENINKVKGKKTLERLTEQVNDGEAVTE